MKKEIVS